MQQTCLLTCCHWTASCGSKNRKDPEQLSYTTAYFYNNSHPTHCQWALLPITVHQHLLRTEAASTLTPRAGLRPAEVSWPRWAPWIRWRCTSSLAEGSVQKWSDVFSLVYSRAQGPTENTTQTVNKIKNISVLPQLISPVCNIKDDLLS